MNRRSPWTLLLLLLLARCERDNPAYCDETTRCPEGHACQLSSHRCVAGPGEPVSPASGADLGEPGPGPDLGPEEDMTMPPPEPEDLQSPADLQGAADLQGPADLQSPADLQGPADLRSPADLSVPPDLRLSADLSVPPDLRPPADLRPPPDLAPPADMRTGCSADTECDPDHQCVMATCYRPCTSDLHCVIDVPGGLVCVAGPPIQHCGCLGDGDCPVTGTRCNPGRKLCLCGGTVCKVGERCVGGSCQP